MSPAILRNSFVILVALVSLSILALTAWIGPDSNDQFWHLKMGADWVEKGLSPWVDHYSFTYPVHPIANPPVAFQLILYFSVRAFGPEVGPVLLREVAYFLVIGAVFLLLRKQKTHWLILSLALTLVVYLLQVRVYLRPEVFSYLFSILALGLYFRFEDRITLKRGIAIVLLMWIWSLYHSSIIGYVIFAGYFLDCGLRQLQDREGFGAWSIWLASGLLTIAVGFLNPGFSNPLVFALTHAPQLKVLITENLPSLPFLSATEGGLVLAVMGAVYPVLALRQKMYGYLLIWAVLAFVSINMFRMLAPAGLVLGLLFAHMLNTELEARREPGNASTLSRVAAVIVGVAVFALLYASAALSLRYMIQSKQEIYRFPQALVAYLDEEGASGRVFNEHGLGGYLINELSPEMQVYVDGRQSILYPMEHVLKWNRAVNDPQLLAGELDRYAVDYILLRYPDSLDTVYRSGGFSLDFVDAFYALYSRSRGELETFGALQFQPACWENADKAKLAGEYDHLRSVNPSYSAIRPFADLIMGYLRARDGRAYFDSQIDQETWTDPMRRFAGFRMLKMGEFGVAGILFWSVEKKKGLDYLAEAYAMGAQGRSEVIGRILHEWLKNRPFDLSAHESRVLLQVLRMNEGVVHQNAWLADLASKVEQQPESETSAPPTAEMFCPSESG